ncbi:MAG: hypothetical protein R3A12_00030 [Ignavibacteria bacterium]
MIKRKPKAPVEAPKPAGSGDGNKTFTRAKLPDRSSGDKRFRDRKDKEKEETGNRTGKKVPSKT